MICTNARIPRACLKAYARTSRRVRRKNTGNFDPITSTRGFLQMSAPRKGSICNDDSSDTGVKTSKVIHPRSIQRLYEGKRVYEGEIIPLPTRPTSPVETIPVIPPNAGQVKVTDFAFNSLRHSQRSKHSGRSGSVASIGGIAFNLKYLGSEIPSAANPIVPPSDSSPTVRRKSAVTRETDLVFPSAHPTLNSRSRGFSESESVPVQNSDGKCKVSWSKAFAAATAMATGSADSNASSKCPVISRASSGGSLAGNASVSAVDWRFHKQKAQPLYEINKDRAKKSRSSSGLRGSHNYSSSDVLSGIAVASGPNENRTVTPDSISGLTSGKDKVQPLFSDKEMDKM